VKVTLWGTRGSLAAPGPETNRYGGNTSCVEVQADDGTRLVLDAGTGIRRLGEAMDRDTKRVDLLLTHLHMDHIQGLGFFDPLFWEGLEVHLWGPPSTTLDLRARLGRYLSPPLFPVHLRDLPCRLTLHDVVALGRFSIGPFEVTASLVCHPGPTVGYRIECDGASVVYLPDHEPALGVRHFPEESDWTSGMALARGADLLIHDAQYSNGEYRQHVGWGHSTLEHAAAFASAAGVKTLVPFHHDPAHSDEILDRLIADLRRNVDRSLRISDGAEGSSFELSGAP
jgi:phosphoribosyl 1,2-cyclic phosphodiesterase